MKILLAHHHKLFRDFIGPILARLGSRPTLIEAASFAESLRPEIVAIDLMLIADDLPGMAGIAGLMELVRLHPETPVAVLMDHADPLKVLTAMSGGAAAVIFKSISSGGLLAALRLVLAGERFLPQETISSLEQMMRQPLNVSPVGADFSPAEREVVPLLRRGLCNKTIGSALGIEEAAVKARLRGIYRKIGVVNRVQAAMALQCADDLPSLPDRRFERALN
jgi:DNA-binding NarL/FixJ family response regulator